MSAGQYIRRAAGYFIKLVVLVGLLYLLMFVTGTARVSAEFFFRELFTTPRGILLMAALAVLSAFYPKFGYVSREAEADIVADRDAIINAFHAAGYGRRSSGRIDDLPRRFVSPQAVAHLRRPGDGEDLWGRHRY